LSDGTLGLIDQLSQWLGGAATAIVAATVGRLMYHSQEVEKKHRKFFGWELLWEIPTAAGMAIIGDAMANYLHLPPNVGVGFIGVCSYLGPRWLETLVNPIIEKIGNLFKS
jgi:hypothetical protein